MEDRTIVHLYGGQRNPWKQLATQLLMDLHFRLVPKEAEKRQLEEVGRLIAKDQPEAAHEILLGAKSEELQIARS